MTLVWMEGFETHTTRAALLDKYDRGIASSYDISLDAATVTVTGRVAPKALEWSARDKIKTPLLTVGGGAGTPPFAGTIGFALFVDSTTGAPDIVGGGGATVSSKDGQCVNLINHNSGTDTPFIFVKIATDYANNRYKFQIFNVDGAQLGVDSSWVTTDAWHYIEVQFIIGDGSPVTTPSIDIRSDESLILNQGIVANDPDEYELYSRVEFASPFHANAHNILIDDIYIVVDDLLGVGGYQGDVVVEGVRPTNTKSPDAQQWIPSAAADHETLIDDVSTASGAHDDDGTFLYTTGVNKKEYFKPESLSVVTGNVIGVQHTAYLRLSDAGSRNVRFKYIDPDTSPTELNGDDIAINSTSYGPIEEVYEYADGSSTLFTTGKINNGNFGLESTS